MNGGTWKVCSPTTVTQDGWGGFSAVGYSFGKRLQDTLKVPIGLVEDCWGGTSAEAWTSESGLRPLEDFAPQLTTVESRAKTGGPVFGTYHNLWLDENDRGAREGWQAAVYDESGWATTEIGPPSIGGVARGPAKVLWYRKTIDVPAGGAATLVLNRVDDTDTTWVNGEFLGTTSFDWALRRYRVVLKPGRNAVAVRVFTTRVGGPFLEDIHLEATDGTKIPLAGEWRTKVELDTREVASRPRDDEPNPTVPTTLYNGMIASLAPWSM